MEKIIKYLKKGVTVPEKILKGTKVVAGTPIKKKSSSWVLVLPYTFIKAMGIEKGVLCDVYRNENDQLVVEIVKPDKENEG